MTCSCIVRTLNCVRINAIVSLRVVYFIQRMTSTFDGVLIPMVVLRASPLIPHTEQDRVLGHPTKQKVVLHPKDKRRQVLLWEL